MDQYHRRFDVTGVAQRRALLIVFWRVFRRTPVYLDLLRIAAVRHQVKQDYAFIIADGSGAPGSSGGGVFTMGPFGNYRLVGVLVEVAVDQGDGFFFGREKVNYLSRAVPLETIITFIHG